MAIVTVTQALRKLYKAIVGEDTTKNNPTKIISELADNWSGGGGGGSSDLSIANVTVVNNALGTCDVSGALATLLGPDIEGTIAVGSAERGSTTVLKLVLYKGVAKFALYGPTSSDTITVEGSATYDETTADYTITGDCTFTVNPAS